MHTLLRIFDDFHVLVMPIKKKLRSVLMSGRRVSFATRDSGSYPRLMSSMLSVECIVDS